MPRGGYRPGGGRPKGSPNRLDVGREAPPPDFRALTEMRVAARILRNLMVEELNAKQAGAKNKKALQLATKDYLRALKEIVPYEDPRLLAVAIAPPPPERLPGDNARVIDLRIFEDTGTAVGLLEGQAKGDAA